MQRSRRWSGCTWLRVASILCCCGPLAPLHALADPRPQCAAAVGTDGSAGATAFAAVSAGDIPIAHTPAGGYRDRFPAPVLATCTEPLAPGAPDLRGLWRTLRAERADDTSSRPYAVVRFLFRQALGIEPERHPLPAGHPMHVYVERIEQCGDRIVDMGGGTVADARADGTLEHGVNDVSAFDFESPIQAIASYEDGVFVLRPPHIPIRVTRRLDADGHMVWHRPDLGDMLVTLERIGGPCDTPSGTAWAR